MTQLSFFIEVKPKSADPEKQRDRWEDIGGWRYVRFDCLMELIKDMNGTYFKGCIDSKITYKGELKAATRVYIFTNR